MRWTEQGIKALKATDRRQLLQENNLQLRIQPEPSGSKSWFHYVGKSRSPKFLGKYPAVNLQKAKKLSLKASTDEYLGDNPESKLTFKQYINTPSFLKWSKKERKSHDARMRVLEDTICPQLGNIRMQDITKQDLDDCKYALGATVANSSVNRYLNDARSVLSRAYEYGVIRERFVIENLKVDKSKVKRYLTDEEEDAIRRACREPLEGLAEEDYLKRGHLSLIVDIALFCGCRLGEILAIKYSDIENPSKSRKKKKVKAHRQTEAGEELYEDVEVYLDSFGEDTWFLNLRGETTKTGQSRQVVLPAFLQKELTNWWTVNLTEQELIETGMGIAKSLKTRKANTVHHDKLLFPYKSIKTAFNKARDRAGLGKDITFHSLRHHFCSKALASGVPIQYVKHIAGHASITTTEIYLHVIPKDKHKKIASYWEDIHRFELEEDDD